MGLIACMIHQTNLSENNGHSVHSYHGGGGGGGGGGSPAS
jgi:hypothetical protein